MASLHGPQFCDQMPRRKGFLDLSSSLQDPHQWPALGGPVDLEQKKKAGFPPFVSTSPARSFGLRHKTNSFGESSTSSTKSSSSGCLLKSESDFESASDIQTPTLDLSRQNSISENRSCDGAPGDSPAQNSSSTPEKSEENPPNMRRNSSDDTVSAAIKKRAPKTKWIPLDLPRPSTGLSVQEKLRLRRYHMTSGFSPDSGTGPQQTPAPLRAPSDRETRPPPRTYGYSGSYYSYNHHTPARPSFGYAGNGGSHRGGPEGANTFGGWQRPVWKNRPKFRKYLGFRNRDIKYDSEYAGRDGDQFSETADDSSLYESYDQSYYDDGSRTPSEWNYYSDFEHNGAADSMLDSSFVSGMSSEGYVTDEYDPFGGYYMDPCLEGQPGYYTMEEESEGFCASTDVALKQLIKTQMEYYFSPENLEKDFFLRQNMAEDGSVLLSLVASFQRIRSLSQDFYMILEAVGDSEQVELLDGFMVRPRNNPQLWPLKCDDNSTTYYMVDGEIPVEDSNWTYYDERFCIAPTKDEENESGHCDDGYQEDGEEEVEESVSLGGSEVEVSDLTSEFKVEMLREQIEPLAV